MIWFDVAWRKHVKACLGYGPICDPRLAHPFGVPEDMPPHVWRVSSDVMQALTEAGPPPYPIPNPKSGDDGVKRLFGWEVVTDAALPAGSMALVEAIR
ncbi:MAG TPA: hypothetical protein VGQ64_01830 [Candidatus Limnocylindrales bacterium]|jgi:hypothetical protein|nr:hypothetical protein [Candidatus Limnocylindrales bacterium]